MSFLLNFHASFKRVHWCLRLRFRPFSELRGEEKEEGFKSIAKASDNSTLYSVLWWEGFV
jgi:hypothetical protein